MAKKKQMELVAAPSSRLAFTEAKQRALQPKDAAGPGFGSPQAQTGRKSSH